jgi:tetratricopeptide (TPR) repeat protein
MKTLRIFISSPNDVAEERGKARVVIESLERQYERLARLEVVMWEDLALSVDQSAQQSIARVLSEKDGVDIAVFILWSRLGSELSEKATPRPGGGGYRSGTEHEFDLMLAARQESGGKKPHILAYWRQDEKTFIENLKHEAPTNYQKLLEQRELARRFVEERFMDEEGRNIRGLHMFAEPVSFAQRLNCHLRQVLDELLAADWAAPSWTEAPYRSLEVFDIRHAPIFYGRDEETCDLLQRLRDQERAGCAFACIVGASGSGKSSLARAGAAATLMQRSYDDGVKEWRAAVFLPSLAAGDLFAALARSLAGQLPELREGAGGIERFAKRIEDNHEAATDLLDAAFKAASDKLSGPLRLLLVLDQMEELWTDRAITPDQREKFLPAVEALARSGRLSVLATLRSDFYPQAQLSEAFLRMKGERGHFDLTPPGPVALHELIVQPAHRAGLSFERDERTGRTLDQRILEDAARDPSALPLLQYALSELYERHDEKLRLLTFAAYQALGEKADGNGVEGALGQRAAQTFDSLSDDAKATLGELLPLLVSVDIAAGHNAVRRRAPLADLTSTPARRVLTERLIAARFLTTDEQRGAPVATLAHESLLRRWDRITTWIDTNRDHLRMRINVEQSQRRWEDQGREPSLLLPPGLPSEEARCLRREAPQLLDAATNAYIGESLAQERRVRAKRRWTLAAVLLVILGAAFLSYTGWRKWTWQRDLDGWRNQLRSVIAEPVFDPDTARALSDRILARNRRDAGAWLALARALLELEEFAALDQLFAEWPRQVSPRPPEIDEIVADAAWKRGSKSEALQHWLTFEQHPGLDAGPRRRVRKKLVARNCELGRWSEAEEVLNRWIAEEDGLEVRLLRITTDRELRRWDQLREDIEAVRKLAPGDPAVRQLSSLPEPAGTNALDEEIQRSPRDPDRWLARAVAFAKGRQFRAALEDVQTARKLDPDAARLVIEEAHLRWQLGEDPAAEATPVDASRWKREADAFPAAYEAMERELTPLDELDRRLRADTENAAHYLARGGSLAKLGQHALAIADFTRAFELRPSEGEALQRRAASLRALGKDAAAAADLRQAEKLSNPTSAPPP